jgi:hypothetical protein
MTGQNRTYPIWLGGPWEGRPVWAPPNQYWIVKVRVGHRDPDRRNALEAAVERGNLGTIGRYVRVGRSRTGRPYFCWEGTALHPVRSAAIVWRVRERFGADGVQLLLELSEGLGLEQAVRRLL